MHIIVKIIGYSIFGFVSFLLLYCIAALLLSLIPINKHPQNKHDVSIYILSNGIHTDIAVPVKTNEKDWSQQIKYANTPGKDTTASYLAFGWGDKAFFMETPTWNDLKFSVTFKSIIGCNTVAIHTTFLSSIIESNRCIRLQISNEQYLQLINYIQESFSCNSNNEFIFIPTDKNYGSNDAFYKGKGHLSLFKTCNTWTNNALKACGQKACIWTPFDKGILFQYEVTNLFFRIYT